MALGPVVFPIEDGEGGDIDVYPPARTKIKLRCSDELPRIVQMLQDIE
jgi:hypothetical protein